MLFFTCLYRSTSQTHDQLDDFLEKLDLLLSDIDDLNRYCSIFTRDLNPIQDGLFRGCRPPPLPKICCTYPTMMKLGTVITYLKEIQKLYGLRNTPV